MRPRLLIISRAQFGYHTGCYYYCKHLRDEYEIAYLGWDFGFPPIELTGIQVINVPRQGNKLVRFFRFLWRAAVEARKAYDLRFVMHFPGCSLLLPLAGRRRSWILDVRTASVEASPRRRRREDRLLHLEARCFEHVTVISAGVAQRLGLTSYHLLPPGADVLSTTLKEFAGPIRLLYVGTIANRGIEDTLRGLRAWLDGDGRGTDTRYTIVGGGFGDEERALAKLVEDLKLAGYVDLVGRVPHAQLTPFFDSHNIGVAFIPTTVYYDHQPPFKTMEYLLAGMAVLATGTAENRRLVDDRSGEIISADQEGFRAGLAQLSARAAGLSSAAIRQANRHHEWSNIIDGNLRPYLASLLAAR